MFTVIILDDYDHETLRVCTDTVYKYLGDSGQIICASTKEKECLFCQDYPNVTFAYGKKETLLLNNIITKGVFNDYVIILNSSCILSPEFFPNLALSTVNNNLVFCRVDAALPDLSRSVSDDRLSMTPNGSLCRMLCFAFNKKKGIEVGLFDEDFKSNDSISHGIAFCKTMIKEGCNPIYSKKSLVYSVRSTTRKNKERDHIGKSIRRMIRKDVPDLAIKNVTIIIPSKEAHVRSEVEKYLYSGDEVICFTSGKQTLVKNLNKYISKAKNDIIILPSLENNNIPSNIIEQFRTKCGSKDLLVKQFNGSMWVCFNSDIYRYNTSPCLSIKEFQMSLVSVYNENLSSLDDHKISDIEVKNVRKKKQIIKKTGLEDAHLEVSYNSGKGISLIIPFMYLGDRFPLFEATVKRLYELTAEFTNIEIIIHETGEIRKLDDSFLNKYQLKYMFSEWNEVFHRGWALNCPVKHVATGEKLVFFDADVIVTEEWLEELMDCSPGVHIGWGRMFNLTKNATDMFCSTGELIETTTRIRTPSLLGAAGGVTVVDRFMFETLGGWPEDFRGTYGGEDNAMILKMVKMVGKPPTFDAKVYHLHHSHSTYKNPLRNAIIQDMKYWNKDQWNCHIKANKDWGKRVFDSVILDKSKKYQITKEKICKPVKKQDKLNILWLGIDRSTRVASHFNDLRNAYSKVANVTTLEHDLNSMHPMDFVKGCVSGDIVPPNIVENHLSIHDEYDFIVCDAGFAFGNEDWDNIRIPKAMIIEDQHGPNPLYQAEMAKRHNFMVLHRYQFNKYHQFLSNYTKCVWFPHSVNTTMFHDYKLSKKTGVLQTGAVYQVYKTRNAIKENLSNELFYKYIPRPKEDAKRKWPVGQDYAKELNSSWMVACCGSTHQYPVMKYFEIPACGSIIYGDYFDELGELGFQPDINMIVADTSNIKRQTESLLQNKSKLQGICYNGIKLINDKHTNQSRANDLDSILRAEINGD